MGCLHAALGFARTTARHARAESDQVLPNSPGTSRRATPLDYRWEPRIADAAGGSYGSAQEHAARSWRSGIVESRKAPHFAIDDLPAMVQAAYGQGMTPHPGTSPKLRHACALVSDLAYRCEKDMYLDAKSRVLPIPWLTIEAIAGRTDGVSDDSVKATDYLDELGEAGPCFVLVTEFIVVGIVVQAKLLLGFRGLTDSTTTFPSIAKSSACVGWVRVAVGCTRGSGRRLSAYSLPC